ncbi:MAG: ATP-binding protein, partial [Oculatellaceae cyanobacterium bins.114]|nr:ATP-binding protein [Oculatellaceae cyanobacterium bins.114]
LAIVADQPQSEVAIALWWALKEELVLPRSDIYKFYQAQDSRRTKHPFLQHPPDTVSYRFLHDRVQQAAYRLIPDAEKQATHLKIGQRLLHSISPLEQDDHLFAIVNQLNLGAALIRDPIEQQNLAILNLSAGKKAKNCTAYRAAMDYANIGIRCLSVQAWQEQYDLALSLYGLATEVAYLCGDFQQMETCAQTVLQHAHSLFDKIEVYNVQILAYTATNKPLEAVELALCILRQLGTVLPESPTDEDIQQTLSTVAALHPPQGIASLVDLPRMSDRNALAALQILNAIFTPCYAVAPKLIPLISATGAKLSMTYGSAPLSVIAYAGYGMLLCGVANDLAAGYEFGQLALNLLPRFSEAAIQTRVMCMVAAFVLHWRNPLRETISTLQAAFQSGMETGDLQYTAWSYYHDCQGSYLSGQELASLDRKLTHYEQALTQIKQDFQRDRSEMLHQVVLNLLGHSRTPCQIVGTLYDETVSQHHYQVTNNTEALYFLHFHRLLLCYWFGHIEQAWEEANEAERYLTSVPAQAVVPVFYVYDSLARLARYDNLSTSAQQQVMERVQSNQARLAHWKTFAPNNYQHKFDLVEAEIARISGQKSLAIDGYDRAIAKARAEGYYQEEGLANELAAQFYLAWNKTIIAQAYLIDAYYCYGRWGAKAKVEDLERRYPHLLAPILNQLTDLSDLGVTHTLPPTGRKNSPLDLMSVMKASQILSGEIEQPNLLTTLLQVMLENAGADRGAILLPQADRLDVVVQGGSQDPFDLTPVPLETLTTLPLSLIRAAQRTQSPTIVNDVAANPALAADPYLSIQAPKSLLCLPILRQSQLVAMLYLENRLTTGAFTADRLQVLNLLCTQAAISLENAHLYQQAQNYSQQVEHSLRELQQAQLQLVQSEKMSALGNLVAGVAHEINNPVGFLAGNLNPAKTYIQGLLGLINRYQQQFPNPGLDIEQEIVTIDLDFVREDLPKLIGSMQVGIERIKSISTSLRAFSRADTEYKVNADLHEGIDSALLILKYRLKANQHRPEIEVLKDYGKLPLIQCFPGQLNQVFMNILANAIDMFDEMAQDQSYKAIALNPQRITIQTTVVEDQAQILIQDNGKGMTEEVKAKVFDYLFTTKDVGKGTGLGLAITHQIVTEKHYGSLEVQSELGQGTTFCIRLPISDESIVPEQF